jgi:eukaryotic-like serine/threonine-protein kinase
VSGFEAHRQYLQAGDQIGVPMAGSLYEIDDLIGAASTAQVYEARDLIRNQPVAVKMYHAETADEIIQKERERLEQFGDKPGFVPYFDHGDHFDREYGDHAYLVMGLLRNGTLDRLIQKGNAAPEAATITEAVTALKGVSKALGVLHDRGLIYGDIKPDNIGLDEQHEGKLIDLGNVVEESDPRRATRGTIGYLAPETIDGSPEAASDVFAVGNTLYSVVTGGQNPWLRSRRNAFPPTWEGEMAYFNQYIEGLMNTDRPVFPHIHNPNVPPALSELIMNCIELRPDQRPTATQLGSSLASIESALA